MILTRSSKALSTAARLLGLAAVLGCSTATDPVVDVPEVLHTRLEVTIEPVRVSELAVTSEFTGNLLPRRRTVLIAEVDGVVSEIMTSPDKVEVQLAGQKYSEQLGFGYGQSVLAGEPIVRLDPAVHELQLRSAEARLAKARADLAKLAAGDRPETVRRITAMRDEANARYQQAVLERQHSERLDQSNGITASSLQQARTDEAAAKAVLERQEATLQQAKAGPTAEEIAVQQALVAEAQAEVAEIQRRVDKCVIRAPWDGVITELHVEQGDHISATSGEIAELLDLSLLAAEFGVPETFLGTIQRNDLAQVFTSGSEAPVPGVVIRINDKVDPESRTFRVRVVIDNRSGRFKAGQFARTQLRLDRRSRVVNVPAAAMVFSDGQPQVFVLTGEVVEQRNVEVGLSTESSIEIRSGLAVGEMVVTDDPTLLADGMGVRRRNISTQPTADRTVTR